MHQRPDDEARELTEKFIAKYAGKPVEATKAPSSDAADQARKSPKQKAEKS
jgi:hypothetical protein